MEIRLIDYDLVSEWRRRTCVIGSLVEQQVGKGCFFLKHVDCLPACLFSRVHYCSSLKRFFFITFASELNYVPCVLPPMPPVAADNSSFFYGCVHKIARNCHNKINIMYNPRAKRLPTYLRKSSAVYVLQNILPRDHQQITKVSKRRQRTAAT